jgi:purine nucleosidase
MIIDTDAGVDDALAILMALADPSVEVVGITTLNGNVSLPNVERNVGTILNAFGAGHIPIYRGAARPLLVDAPDAADIHGADGLGDAGLRAPRDLEATHAALGIIELAKRYPGCTLVTLRTFSPILPSHYHLSQI